MSRSDRRQAGLEVLLSSAVQWWWECCSFQLLNYRYFPLGFKAGYTGSPFHVMEALRHNSAAPWQPIEGRPIKYYVSEPLQSGRVSSRVTGIAEQWRSLSCSANAMSAEEKASQEDCREKAGLFNTKEGSRGLWVALRRLSPMETDAPSSLCPINICLDYRAQRKDSVGSPPWRN